jgi:hypothetical protein
LYVNSYYQASGVEILYQLKNPSNCNTTLAQAVNALNASTMLEADKNTEQIDEIILKRLSKKHPTWLIPRRWGSN